MAGADSHIHRTPDRVGRWGWAVAALMVIVAVAALAVQHNAFPYYSGDHDEPVYRYQAQMLGDGRLTIPRSQEQFFQPWLSGPHGDHLVMAFSLGWPAVLLAAQTVTSTMLGALAFAAALLPLSVFLLAREILKRTGQAFAAAVVVSLSPFVLTLSGTYLNYAFSLALGSLFGWLALLALRTGRRVTMAGAGVTLGLLLITRPFDAILFAIPFVWLALVELWHDRAGLTRTIGWFALGLAPFVIATAAINAVTAGSPLAFSTVVQSGGASTFGWGTRSIAPNSPPLDFTPSFAFSAMGENLWALPTWLLGTYLTLALAIAGGYFMARRERRTAALVVGMAVIFPVGYLTWWASALTPGGAMNGLGPHYYLPLCVPLAIFAVYGTCALLEHLTARKHVAVIVGVVAGLVLTAVALPPKLTDKTNAAQAGRRYAQQVKSATRRATARPEIVIQERVHSPYIMEPHPYLANNPGLTGRTVYATDKGADSVDLVRSHPDRETVRLVLQLAPGAPFSKARIVAKPDRVVAGPAVEVRNEVTNISGKPVVIAYARFGDHRAAHVLDLHSTKGATYRYSWVLRPKGISFVGSGTDSDFRAKDKPYHREFKSETPPPAYGFVNGVAFLDTADEHDPDLAAQNYYARTARVDGRKQVQVLTASEELTRIGAPYSVWLPITTDHVLRTTFSTPAGSPVPEG